MIGPPHLASPVSAALKTQIGAASELPEHGALESFRLRGGWMEADGRSSSNPSFLLDRPAATIADEMMMLIEGRINGVSVQRQENPHAICWALNTV
ncbi:hypothetical protein B7463_g4498, partial [Scytalidium lignicola]